MKTITIKWGTEQNEKKTYSFDNEHDLKMFMKGVDEANGWLDYYIVDEQITDPTPPEMDNFFGNHLGMKKEIIDDGIVCYTLTNNNK